jgi:hypothetical protein
LKDFWFLSRQRKVGSGTVLFRAQIPAAAPAKLYGWMISILIDLLCFQKTYKLDEEDVCSFIDEHITLPAKNHEIFID